MYRSIFERRVKVAYFDQRLFVAMLNAVATRQTLILPPWKSLPAGVEVVSLWISQSRRAIEALLFHPSWPEIEHGTEPPAIDDGPFISYEQFVAVPLDDSRKRMMFATLEADASRFEELIWQSFRNSANPMVFRNELKPGDEIDCGPMGKGRVLPDPQGGNGAIQVDIGCIPSRSGVVPSIDLLSPISVVTDLPDRLLPEELRSPAPLADEERPAKINFGEFLGSA